MPARRRKREARESLSRTLTWLLRHAAAKEGLTISHDGFIDVDHILTHTSLAGRCTQQDVQEIVLQDSKQRFSLRTSQDGHLQIKANQGHSMEIIKDDSLAPINYASEAPVVIHGTYLHCWQRIKEEGLSRMSRVHIHFAPGEPHSGEVISGMRASCQVYIYIDLEKALADGIPFYRSLNNVILSPGNTDGYIEPKYFAKVVHVSSGISLSETECPSDGGIKSLK